jgi:mono/diheme cytochrome c family protein
MKGAITTALAIGALLFIAAGCGGSGKPADNKTAKDDKLTRPAPPDEYKGKSNPTPDAVEEGKKVFDTHCVTCHGPNGDGDSPVGSALNPPASDFTDPKLQEVMTDEYMFWRVSEGGKSMGYEGMTPFKENLKEWERWAAIAYIRSLKK